MQIVIVLLLLVIALAVAPWLGGVLAIGAAVYAIVGVLFVVVMFFLVGADTLKSIKNSEWARQRRIRKVVEQANRRNRSNQ
ncbi:TPA: hypothetical protein ACRNCK_001696 [Pseudomonas aeruginosa]|uniref:hypothetical protein n=1 Tax=Pseudomonas aeruginosa TaxID=287 RepID=UPI000F838E6C|nr:hypothetical protein [Pseudomonas aeruginosa]QFZ62731.1 hypothetical protein FVF66_19350 [Pseudomonas aeruginosa PA99]EKU3994846.1 hypothetical protein [Pseudomonas aeruginosa]EKV9030662.1 hypothetical protein [Pseudomonas aeruginosa]EKW0330841.1 hypothetical protein [Pseudomonas aeruginosa]EKW2708153.1 hypothetical protein [Pseudomonas aeruginosa]